MTENILTNLIIYRNLITDSIIKNYNSLYMIYNKNKILDNKDEYLKEYYDLCSYLIQNGFDSINDYVSSRILKDENIFSLFCEKGQELNVKVKKAVIHDLMILKKLYEIPLKSISAYASDSNNFLNFESTLELTEVFKKSKTEEIFDYLHKEYSLNGCGEFRDNFAFSTDGIGNIVPVENFNPVRMENIYGYNRQKNKIINNTEKFISGQYALNTLLVGDSGTGKSTTVKALIPMFMNRKLRLIEIDKENLYYIPKVVETLKNRGMFFIIFIDDLSFESNETSYKYLKSVVEGSIYEQPGNILFYVTSNRKHLIKESMKDRENEIHLRDAINEQTSLSERFGLTILYGEPNQSEYYDIVLGLAEKYGIKYEGEQLLAEAKKYAMQNGGRTGRTAVQFIKTL